VPPRSVPTDSGVAFIVGMCDKGATNAPTFVQSLDQFISLCGARVTYSILYDAVDIFFREGGNGAYIGRVVGPAAVAASHTYLDAGAVSSLVLSADSPGAWGNNIKVGIVAGQVTGFAIQVTDASNNILETSYDLVTQADALAWVNTYSQYLTVALGTSTNPPALVAPVALSGGNDDRGNATDAQWLAALNTFGAALGPGQVFAPGRTSTAGTQQLAAHAQANNRVALIDLVDTPTVATLQSGAAAAAGGGAGQYSASFTPWLVVPGATPGTSRIVPPSCAMAGLIARNDVLNNPDTPAAGEQGVFNSVVGLSQPAFTDPVRQTLNGTGVNVIRQMLGGFRNYGYRSLANPVSNMSWVDFSNVRYLMELGARCQAVGEQFMFAVIDGTGHTFSDYGAALSALCQADYSSGQIFGSVPEDAFNVDTGPSVNTPATIADNQLRAVVAVRPSPFAELVSILIVNTPITQAVA
jgi:hypothetical protein